MVSMQIVVQTDLRGVISGFRVSDEEFRGFFSSVVHEILQFDLCAIGGVEPRGGLCHRGCYCEVGAPSGGGLCYRGAFLRGGAPSGGELCYRGRYCEGGAPSGGGLCYGGEFLLRRVV